MVSPMDRNLDRILNDARRRRPVAHDDLFPTHVLTENTSAIPLKGLFVTLIAVDSRDDSAFVLVHATPGELASRSRAVGVEIQPREFRRRFERQFPDDAAYSKRSGYTTVPIAALRALAN